MVCVDCGQLSADGAALFGRGARPGLLSSLRDGTLLLSNVHLSPPALSASLVRLVSTGEYLSASGASAGGGGVATGEGGEDGEKRQQRQKRTTGARIMITAERRSARFEDLMAVIRVPPLRVRPADIVPLTVFFLRDLARRTGARAPATLSAAAMRQLQAYSFPDNIAELQAVVERAALRSRERVTAAAADSKKLARLTAEKLLARTTEGGGRKWRRKRRCPQASAALGFFACCCRFSFFFFLFFFYLVAFFGKGCFSLSDLFFVHGAPRTCCHQRRRRQRQRCQRRQWQLKGGGGGFCSLPSAPGHGFARGALLRDHLRRLVLIRLGRRRPRANQPPGHVSLAQGVRAQRLLEGDAALQGHRTAVRRLRRLLVPRAAGPGAQLRAQLVLVLVSL